MSFLKYTAIYLFIVLSGCATFRDGPNPPITKWPPGDAPNKTIAIQVSGEEAQAQALGLDIWRLEILRAYETAGLFSAVKVGSERADIRADVTIIDKREGNTGLNLLSSFTLFIIPGYRQGEFVVRTTYKDKHGTILGSFRKSEVSSQWVGWLLLPLSPFFPSSVEDILFDLNRNTILEAHSKGIF